jgi:hypothetical protein
LNRSSNRRLRQVPSGFRASRELKFSPAQIEAIRAAEEAMGYRQHPPAAPVEVELPAVALTAAALVWALIRFAARAALIFLGVYVLLLLFGAVIAGIRGSLARSSAEVVQTQPAASQAGGGEAFNLAPALPQATQNAVNIEQLPLSRSMPNLLVEELAPDPQPVDQAPQPADAEPQPAPPESVAQAHAARGPRLASPPEPFSAFSQQEVDGAPNVCIVPQRSAASPRMGNDEGPASEAGNFNQTRTRKSRRHAKKHSFFIRAFIGVGKAVGKGADLVLTPPDLSDLDRWRRHNN